MFCRLYKIFAESPKTSQFLTVIVVLFKISTPTEWELSQQSNIQNDHEYSEIKLLEALFLPLQQKKITWNGEGKIKT